MRREPIAGSRKPKVGFRERSRAPGSRLPASERGFTLLELLVVMTIIGILAAVAIPALRDSPQRAREAALREDLFTLRSTIDQYHGDKGYYPPDLATLVSDGYIRQIPVDPMTKKAEWGQRSFQDEPDSFAWGGQNVYDIYTLSTGRAIDGTQYKDW